MRIPLAEKLEAAGEGNACDVVLEMLWIVGTH